MSVGKLGCGAVTMLHPFGFSPGVTVTEFPAALNFTECPASMSFSEVGVRCSSRTRFMVMPFSLQPAMAAATMNVPASMRSGMMVCSTPWSLSTP